MSELTTTYTTFNVFDYKNQNVLSSFALSSTPLRFFPELTDVFAHKVVWSFGDGTKSNLLCASKYYDFPGQYTVNLVVYDCYNNAQISSYSQNITIKDFVTFTFTLSATDSVLENGKIHGPWEVKTYYPPYQPQSNIFYDISGSNSSYYFDISSNKFSHLENYYSLYQTLSNVSLSTLQYEEINDIVTPTTRLFCKLDNNSIVACSEFDVGAFFVGLSGYKQVYFKDDTISNKILLKFNFDKTNNFDGTQIVSYLNNLGITLSASIVENTDVSRLSITSNGLDGEGYAVDSFNLSPIKFQNTNIPFIIKIKDSDNFSVKNFDNLEQSDFNFVVLSSGSPINSSYYTISSLNSTLSAQTHYGSFRGYIRFINLPDNVISNITLSANISTTNNQATSYTIAGVASGFEVYPADYYEMYKINENFDALEMFKDLRFQETLLDKPVLFDDFMGSIFGTLSSSYESLGKKIYEKIANFVANNQDVDRSEIFALLSNMEFLNVNVNVYDSTLFNYPEIIKRILNFASINKNKLFGTTNKFKENFDIKGHSSKDTFGRNLGDEITTNTYVITAGIPIVALEKFSGDYTLLNTMQPLCALSGSQLYMLSAYNANWGWPLVLPFDFTYSDFEKYYYFFKYVDVYDGTITNNTIDFDNTLTTVSQSATMYQTFSDNGIFVNMISDSLYSSLDLYIE